MEAPDAGPAPTLVVVDSAVAALGLRSCLFLLSALSGTSAVPSFRGTKARSRLAPHAEMATQMLRELADQGAIVWSLAPDTRRSWIFAAAPSQEAEWRLGEPLSAIEDLAMQLGRHASALAGLPTATEELFTVWRELAISEVAGFLANELGEHRFDVEWALAAVPAIERGLRKLSANQMFYFCWLAVREAASRYLRFPGSVRTLADSLVSYIDQKVDRAIAERWALRDWSDFRGRIPSAVAATFADQVTNLGSDYLSRVPSRDGLTRSGTTPASAARGESRSRRRISSSGPS